MNYSRAFSAVFDDKNWVSKILIAGLISLIPVIGQIYILGWSIEIVRRVKAGRADILPATHFAYFLTLGLKMVVVGLIYSIPVLLISGIMQLFGAGASNAEGDFISAMFAGLGCLGGIIALVVEFAVGLLGTYGMIKLAETDQIKACLDFQDAFSCIKNNFAAFIIVELLSIVCGLIESAGLIICVGIIFTVPYGVAVNAHLVGQLWDNLKSWNGKDRVIRGSVQETKAEDIIEEAPFTRVNDIEKDLEEKAADSVEEAKESAEDILEDVKESAEEAVESVQDKAEDIAEAVEDKTEEIADAVEDKAEEIADTAAETAEAARENISDVLENGFKPEEEHKSDDNNDLPSFE